MPSRNSRNTTHSATTRGINTNLALTNAHQNTTSVSSILATPPAPLSTFYIRNIHHRKGQLFHVNTPKDVPVTAPVAVAQPKWPEKRHRSLHMFTPGVLYVQYKCDQKCRNLGICVHYQFVVGCKKCPDGLRCDVCVGSGIEEAIRVNRKCPLHQDPTQAKPIGSVPEDFLATDLQKLVCDEVLARSFACKWDDLPPTALEGQAPNTSVAHNPSAVRHPSKVFPAQLPGRHVESPATHRPPPMTPGAAFKPPVDPALPALPPLPPDFDREFTPRTLYDVEILETVEEGDEDGTNADGEDQRRVNRDCDRRNGHDNLAATSVMTLGGLPGGPLEMAMGMARGRFKQGV